MSLELKGLIWNIQRFNIHDGSGIRTLVFFKGCPLRCLWCSNPEGQSPQPEILFDKDRCLQSGLCRNSCSVHAIEYRRNYPEIDREICDACGDCVRICPSGALTIVGKYLSVNEVMKEVLKDEPFYRRSGGGLTLTGGEPLLQADFAGELLKAAKRYFIDTAVETCGHVRWEQFEKVIPFTDTFLYDIKNIDPIQHRNQTGHSNELILENVKKLAGIPAIELIFRTPIIPGENDSRTNLKAIAELAARLDVKRWDIMDYHRFGEGKYEELGRKFPLEGLEPPTNSQMQEILDSIKPIYSKITLSN